MNPAAEYVKASRESSPLRRYVSDHGQGVTQKDIEVVTISGRPIAISADVNDEEYSLIKEAIQSIGPTEKSCFANALKMWEFDNQFAYAEGFAVTGDLDGVEHAWCMLNGNKLVDVTAAFDYYFGAIVSDPEVMKQYTGSDLTTNGIIGNHKNRFEFLRKRGYTDYQ